MNFFVVVFGVVFETSQLGLLAPLVQQYFPKVLVSNDILFKKKASNLPFPPFSQQSGLLAPFLQQYFPLPPLGH